MSTKLSHNQVHTLPWEMPDLSTSPLDLSELEAEIQDLFTNQPGVKPHRQNEGSACLHRVGTGKAAVGWAPEVFDQVAVGELPANWAFFGDAPDTGLAEADSIDEIRRNRAAAKEILEKAHRDAQEVILRAEQEAAEMRARNQAKVDQAITEGRQQGWDSARQEAASMLQSVSAMIQEIASWKAGLFTQGETILREMAHEIAVVMFGEGVQMDNEGLQRNLNRILENAHSLGDLKIFINPRDAATLDHSWREVQELVMGSRVQLIPSDSILPGGCFVQGQMGTVDAQVETQLKAVLETLNTPVEGEV